MTHHRDIGPHAENHGNRSPAFALALAFVTAFALVLRLYHLEFESLWYDELSQVATYHLPLTHLVPAAAGHGQPPLDYLIGAALERLGLATSDWWVRLPAAIFGVASVGLVGLLVKRIAGPVAAISAAILFAVCPLHIVMSQEARPYTIFVFSVLLTLLTLDFARRRHTPAAWMLFTATSTVMILTRWVGPHIVIAASSIYIISAWLITRRDADRNARVRESQRLWAFFSAVAVAYAVFGPIFGLILDRTRGVVHVSQSAWFPRVVAQLGDAYQAVWGGYSTSMLYSALPAPQWLLVVGGLLGVIGISYTLRTATRSPATALLLTVLLPFPLLFAALYTKMTSIPPKPQYLLLTSVPLVMVVSIGLERIRVTLTIRHRTVGSLVFAVLFASLVLSMGSASWSLLNQHDKRDWRGLMTFLNHHASPGDAFAIAAADTVPASFHPAVGGKARYGMGHAKFLPIDLDTDLEAFTRESWHHPNNIVWIVGIKDRLYRGSEQLPAPAGVPNDIILRDFPGVFVVGIPGSDPPMRRLARGITVITKHLPEGSAVVAPHLLRGRLLLSRGDITDARSAFDEAARQCRTPQELETLIRDYLPQSIADRSLTASQLK